MSEEKPVIYVIFDSLLSRYYHDGIEMNLEEWLQFRKEHQNEEIRVLTLNRPPQETMRRSETRNEE